MKRSAIVLVALLFSSPVAAMPPGAMGKWTTKKGDCRNAERIVRIEQTKYKSYESVCKVKSVDPLDRYGVTDHRLNLICDDEGELNHRTVYMSSVHPGDTQVKIHSSDMKDNEFQWLFRCKR